MPKQRKRLREVLWKDARLSDSEEYAPEGRGGRTAVRDDEFPGAGWTDERRNCLAARGRSLCAQPKGTGHAAARYGVGARDCGRSGRACPALVQEREAA
jgi:hypothetical protein